MKHLVTLLFLTSFYSLSADVDSVLHNGKWYKLYPYEQISTIIRKRVNSSSWRNKYLLREEGLMYGALGVSSDVFQPLQDLPDGRYIQVVRVDEFELMGRNYRGRRYRTKPIKMKELNTVRDTLAVYSVFSISDSKLHGDVRFLAPNGDTLIYGQYAENLREGKWLFGDELNISREYKNGLQHGLSTLVKIERKYHSLESTVYERGIKKSYSYQTIYKDYSTREEESYREEGDDEITHKRSYRDDVLQSEGDQIHKRKIGTWKHFSLAGKPISVEQFWDKSIKIESGFKAWHRGLPDAEAGLDVPFIETFDYYSATYSRLWNGYPGSFGMGGAVRCKGDGEYWHPSSGEKWFTYTVTDEGEFIPGTLYYSNGNPRYTFTSDSLFEEYVKTYYDINGVETHQTREAWVRPTKRYGVKIVRYDGENLYKDRNKRQGEHYQHKSMPEWDTLVAQAEPPNVIKAVLRHDGNKLIVQTYYLPEKHIKVHEERFEVDKKKGFVYRLEIRQIFNEDYTEAKTRATLTFEDDYQVVQTFDMRYGENQYKAHKKRLYTDDKDPSGITNSGYTPYMGYFKKPDGTFFKVSDIRNFNWFKRQMGEVSNMKTVYTFEGRTLNGSVKIDKDRDASFKKKGADKYKLTLDHATGSYYHTMQDGFGLTTTFGKYDVLPDLLKDIRLPYGLYFNYNRLHKIEGNFKNGQIHGNWKGYNKAGRLILDANYNEGKLEGKCQIYYWKSKRTYKKSKYLVSKGEKRKVVVPERHFVNVELNYGENGIESFKTIGLDGGTMTSGTYKDGKCFYQEVGYEHYGLFDNEIIDLNNSWKYNNDAPPTAEDHNATKKYFFGQDGLIERIEVDRPGDEDDREQYTFNFDAGALHGSFEMDENIGEFNHGIYSGVIKSDAGNHKYILQYLENGLLVKEELYNEDYKLSQIEIDTNRFKLQGKISLLYSMTPRIPYRNLRTDYTANDTIKKAWFTSFYADGTKRAEGEYWSKGNKKEGVWKYFTPEGMLKNEVLYERGKCPIGDSDSMHYKATLTEYKDDNPLYKAYVIDIISKYNCNLADNYESRQLIIKEDFVAKSEYPTRPLKIYYETGVLQAEGELVDGVPNGLWKFYDSEGGLRSTGLYKNGVRDGRWLAGDLTNAAFIGDFCLNPLAYKFDPNYESELKKNLNISIVVYNMGDEVKSTSISTYLNNK